jgi:hypothetical protein
LKQRKASQKTASAKEREVQKNEDEVRNGFGEELKTPFSLTTMLVCQLIMEVIWKAHQLGD